MANLKHLSIDELNTELKSCHEQQRKLHQKIGGQETREMWIRHYLSNLKAENIEEACSLPVRVIGHNGLPIAQWSGHLFKGAKVRLHMKKGRSIRGKITHVTEGWAIVKTLFSEYLVTRSAIDAAQLV